MKQTRVLLVLSITMLLCGFSNTAQIKKEPLSVLYVGYDPSIPMDPAITKSETATGGMQAERFLGDVNTRFGSFESYLKQYFSKVRTVDARSYKRELSAEYDVTIFDQVVTPWKKQENVKEADGRSKNQPAQYLNEDFDFATIFIGHTAPVMGQSIGLKLDWLCLCLDADAHHLKMEHPIFKGPFPVTLTMVDKPTPEGIYHYPSGKDVPGQIPMWRVQKEGYLEGKGYRMGLVSRGEGFLDSPDAEYISSGVNTKDLNAVAIGRHGNFLLWGFSASPDYMTEEAKLVFANAVVYMKQFKGQKPIARKYNDRIATKASIDDIIAKLNKESFEKYKTDLADFNVQMKKSTDALRAKKEKGEQLSEMEVMVLSMPVREMPVPTWEQYVQQTSREFFKAEYVQNIDALKNFLFENRKFMYSEPDGFYSLKIDEDLKKSGVGNDEKTFLPYYIDLLKSGKDSDLANKLLLRYTGLAMSAEQWGKWLKDNSSKLFFTQAGGYKWLVDTTKKK